MNISHQKLARIAHRLNLSCGQGGPSLLFMTDDKRVPHPAAAIRALPAGTAVIFRHYESPDRTDLAHDCRQACQDQGRLFLVAASPSLAQQVQADGVHLPQGLLANLPRIKMQYPQWLVTTAVHDKRALHAANQSGADAVLASPIFPTPSHPGRPTLGVTQLALWCRSVALPVYALGGIDHVNASRLVPTGAAGIAAIGALM